MRSIEELLDIAKNNNKKAKKGDFTKEELAILVPYLDTLRAQHREWKQDVFAQAFMAAGYVPKRAPYYLSYEDSKIRILAIPCYGEWHSADVLVWPVDGEPQQWMNCRPRTVARIITPGTEFHDGYPEHDDTPDSDSCSEAS